MTAPYLLLWLEAPLQAWGNDSKFGRRDTLTFPTKSGVLGLICCALGAGGEQRELLSELSEGDMQIVAFGRKNSKEDRAVRQPLLMDFQMVGSGYDDSDPWQSLLIPKTSEGKKAVGGGTKLTYRYYVQDMVFAVLLQVPERHCANIVQHLIAPVWDLYLGRKCCAPTEIIYQGTFESAQVAGEKAVALATEKQRLFSFRVLQGEYEGEVITLNDVPLCFGTQKQYRDRRVTLQDWQE
ncbi:MAG: type I-E CRISPR-associated protein Cas5/CasD [Limnobaculum xujianqingii]|uniref:type I-E CRISPR-associated protein Cas5/CasD n=1 Tax=Limnobaculum xujianqingii TaxID=2738837 RepID=UPI00112EF8D6|nr:type I-E CRISPR-associated protein Cas5/CasD [Limnobaculum xujianqingii]